MMRSLPSATLAVSLCTAMLAASSSAVAQPPKAAPTKPALPAPPAKGEPAPPPKPAMKPLQDPSEIADDLHVQAEQAAAKGDWQTARSLLRKAWNLKQSYDIAANLGLAAFELKDFAEAAEAMDYALSHVPTAHDKAQVAQIQKKFDLARAEVATVRVNVNVNGCDVAVDGKSKGKAPLPASIYVAPGRHAFEGNAAGFEPAREERIVDKGAQIVVTLQLRKVGEPTPNGGDKGRVLIMAGGVTLGVGIAAFGAGIGLAVVSHSKAANAKQLSDDLVAAYGPTPCAGAPSDPRCADQPAALSSARGMQTGYIASFVVGGALAAVGAGMMIYGATRPNGDKPTGILVAPVLSPSFQGLVVGGGF